MRRVVVAMIGLSLLLVASCSGGGDVLDIDDVVGPAEDTTSSSSSSTSSSTTSSTRTTEPVGGGDADQAVIETWTGLLEAARTGEPDAEQLAVIEELAGPDTVEQLLTPLFPTASNREIEFFPALTAQDDGTYAIDDCLVMNRGISVGPSNWFVGTAEPDDASPTGWRITEISVISLDPCVPRSIAEAAIAGYEAHWDAREDFLDPPDPDSPALLATTTGEQLVVFRDRIAEIAADGLTTKAPRHATFPEFLEFRSSIEVVIVDCQETNPDYGIVDEATGERTDLIPVVVDGQLDLRETLMVLEDGVWKVADVAGETNVQCRTPPTPPTLRITGG